MINICNPLFLRVLQSVVAITSLSMLMACPDLLATGKNGVTSKKEQSRWSTPWAKIAGVRLVRSFDSSGPDAWGVKKYPLIFITTEGSRYGGLLSGVTLGYIKGAHEQGLSYISN